MKMPVFVYLPPHATLRGGAWVVVDPTINEEHMEMYADERSRGGVLEAEGTVDVKFRRPDVLKTAHRLDPELIALDGKLKSLRTRRAQRAAAAAAAAAATATSTSATTTTTSTTSTSTSTSSSSSSSSSSSMSLSASMSMMDVTDDMTEAELVQVQELIQKQISTREKALFPVYKQVAQSFADLHDRAGRMKAKGVIRQQVEWETSREYFYHRLRRRLAEIQITKKIAKVIPSVVAEKDQKTVADVNMTPASTPKNWVYCRQTANSSGDLPVWERAVQLFQSWVTEKDGEWDNDKNMGAWIQQNSEFVKGKLQALTRDHVQRSVTDLLSQHSDGVLGGLLQAIQSLDSNSKAKLTKALKSK